MLRIKLVVLLVVLLGALTGVALALAEQVRDDLLVEAEEQLKSSNEVVRLAATVHEYSVLDEARAVASVEEIAAGVTCPQTAAELARERAAALATDDDGTAVRPPQRCSRTAHAAVLDALERWNDEREDLRRDNLRRYLSERDPGVAVPRAPDLLIVSDADGVVVARVGFDKDDWFGESRPNMSDFSAVARTELGAAEQDLVVWREHAQGAPQLVRIGTAPLVVDGAFVGAATVGYFVTDTAAEEAIQLLYGTDVAFYYRGQGGTVGFAGTTASTRTQFLDAIVGGSFRGPDETTIPFADLALRTFGVVHRFDYDGAEWMAMSTPLAVDSSDSQVSAGFIVVRSASEAVAPLGRFRQILPVLAGTFVLLGALAILVVVREFMVPIEDVSRGVQEVIAGNLEHMWEVDERSHLSDLAHSLNVMTARLQGKRDPDSDEFEGDDDWEAMATGPAGAPRSAPRTPSTRPDDSTSGDA